MATNIIGMLGWMFVCIGLFMLICLPCAIFLLASSK